LLVEHLPTRVETLRDPTLRGWDERVLDASPEAMMAEVAVGDTRQRVEQLSLLEADVQPRLAQLRAAIRILQQRVGDAIVRLASLVGPPLPLPIKVNLAPNGIPAVLGWGGWSRRVVNIYEYWRERQTWWERATARDYYQLTIEDGTPFTIFHDEQQRWFLDRQRR
jgi:hypothetical protein